MDELAHIPAGYGYVRHLDFRLNPEHPPLVKVLAGLPLIFLGPNFPTDHKAWEKDVNGQWDMGTEFLYRLERQRLARQLRTEVVDITDLASDVRRQPRQIRGEKDGVRRAFAAHGTNGYSRVRRRPAPDRGLQTDGPGYR